VALDGALDTYNAHALDHRGAARVLRELTWPALDGVHPLYAAPETFRVLLCRYRQLSVVGSWEVLARARNRCGAPRFLGSRSARPGELVAIPPAPDPRDAVVGRIH